VQYLNRLRQVLVPLPGTMLVERSPTEIVFVGTIGAKRVVRQLKAGNRGALNVECRTHPGSEGDHQLDPIA